ncbi:MAG: acetate--CoA ligase family protein [Desulfomonilaceae bacterium]
MNDFENHPLYKIMHPKNIAFWGASSNPMSMGSIQLSSLLMLGFEGQIFPIHPRDKEIKGLKAYSRIADVPEKVDLAILVIPTAIVADVLEDCGKAGIDRAIIVSAGFSEKEGDDGKDLQAEIVAIAQKYGIYFIGPNCIGVVNSHLKLNTTFNPYEASAGFIGMASQSGSFITQMFGHLSKFGLGFSQAFSLGNEAMIDLCDCMEYLALCPKTQVIGLYIEGIRRGRLFLEVARRVSRIKPIVAYYVGGSKAGGRAGKSHTGALAGPDRLYNGVFNQSGIIRAESIEQLFDFCYVLGTQPLPKGNRLGILTHSGGPGAAAADRSERAGLELAELGPATLESLRPLLPHTASVKNPVDLTFARNLNDYMSTLPKILLKDDNIDLLFLYTLMPQQRVMQGVAESGMGPEQANQFVHAYIKEQSAAAANLSIEFGKPVVGGTFCDRSELFVRELQDHGMTVLLSPERAVTALGALCRYARWRRIFS